MPAETAYIVRHGHTQYNKEKRITGHVDIPLIQEGIESAEAVVVPEDCTEIISGDSIRHVQTAEIINKTRNLPIRFDPRLRERNFGSYEGQRWEDIDPDDSIWQADKSQQYDYRPQGGESVEDVAARVGECLREIKEGCSGKPLIVTSGGVIRLIKKRMLDEEHGDIPNAVVEEFDLPDSLDKK